MAREVRSAVAELRPLLVAGAPGPAGELARALAADGDSRALRDVSGRRLGRGELRGAEMLVYVVAGDATTEEDEQALRLARRHGVERVCVLVGSGSESTAVRHVDADDVIPVRRGEPLPLDRIAERVAERADETAFVLASKLPSLRSAVVRRIVRRAARQNAVVGAAFFVPGADLPALTLNQLRMVFQIAAAYGEEIDRERAVELVGVVAAGLGFRALARQALGLVPGAGWALKGGIAYAGTRALGESAIRYFEARRARSGRLGGGEEGGRSGDSVRSRS